jgi:Holliday junction resolvase RusA-like endonuclease
MQKLGKEMTELIKFFIAGKPEAQARPRLGKFGNVYSPKTDWYNSCLTEAMKHKPKKPLERPICLCLFFYMPKPKGIKKSQRWHIKRPDYDNLAKAVTDAIVKSGILKDDNIIAKSYIEKIYYEPFGCKIEILDLR